MYQALICNNKQGKFTDEPQQSMPTHRFVIQFPEPLDGQEGPHEEAVHDEQLDEAASLGLEGVDHDVVSRSDTLLID